MMENKEFTQWWHMNAIDQWNRWVPMDVKNALEVGSFEGMSAIWLVQNRPDVTVGCVDIFSSAFDDITGEYEQRFERNVAEYGHRIVKMKGKSADVLAALMTNQYDLIYIDGDHSYDGALNDITAAWPLLQVGGVMICDDYDNAEFGVKQAVNAFVNFHHSEIEVLRQDGDYQFALKRIK